MKSYIRLSILAIAIVLLVTNNGRAADAPATRPANQATTQPAPDSTTYSISGQVNLGSGLGKTEADFKRVVIYLGLDPALDALSTNPDGGTCAQKNKAFVPNFLIVAKGASVEFPNWDHISHNVFSRSAAAPAFDLDRYPYGQSKTRVFDKIGIVQVFCNIHPSMRAIIFVTPNRFFAHADAQGHFEINDVPAGHYEVYAWQDRCGAQHQAIDVGSTSNLPITFSLDENREAILMNDPPRHGQTYGVERGLGVKREHLNLPVVAESHPAVTTEPSDCCAQ
jgi:plastocyanin